MYVCKGICGLFGPIVFNFRKQRHSQSCKKTVCLCRKLGDTKYSLIRKKWNIPAWVHYMARKHNDLGPREMAQWLRACTTLCRGSAVDSQHPPRVADNWCCSSPKAFNDFSCHCRHLLSMHMPTLR